MQLRIATHEEIDSDTAPDCRSECELELVAGGRDGLRRDEEVSGSYEVECEVLEGWISGGVPRAMAGAVEN